MSDIPAWKYNIKHMLDGELRKRPFEFQLEILKWLIAYAERIIANGGIAVRKQKTRHG